MKEFKENNEGCWARIGRSYAEFGYGGGKWNAKCCYDTDWYVVACDSFAIGDTLTLTKK